MISFVQKYYQPDKSCFDLLLYPQRKCHKCWVQLFSSSSSRDLSSCEHLAELIKRVVYVIPLILATLISYVIGVVAVGLKGCTKAKKSSEPIIRPGKLHENERIAQGQPLGKFGENLNAVDAQRSNDLHAISKVIHPSVPSPNSNAPLQPAPSTVIVRKSRNAWLASVNHGLFAVNPLTELMQSYLGVGYLVKIHRYSSPNSGNDFRDRYLSVPRYSGHEFGLLEDNTRNYPGSNRFCLNIKLCSYISDANQIVYLNDLSLSMASTSVGLGALDPRNIELSYAYVELVKVLENDQFREPQEDEKIDTKALSCVGE